MTGNDELSKSNLIGSVSSMSADGRTANVQTFGDGETRNNRNMTPYGISSSPLRGMQAQVMINDNDNTSVVGVFDKDKPKVLPGETIVYSMGGSTIYLKRNGDIDITCGSGLIQMKPDGSISLTGTVTVNGRTI